MLTGQASAAEKSYKSAIDVCLSVGGLTLKVIALAIALEQASFFRRQGSKKATEGLRNALKVGQKCYRGIFQNEEEVPEAIRGLYKDLDLQSEDGEYLWRMSRRVAY